MGPQLILFRQTTTLSIYLKSPRFDQLHIFICRRFGSSILIDFYCSSIFWDLRSFYQMKFGKESSYLFCHEIWELKSLHIDWKCWIVFTISLVSPVNNLFKITLSKKFKSDIFICALVPHWKCTYFSKNFIYKQKLSMDLHERKWWIFRGGETNTRDLSILGLWKPVADLRNGLGTVNYFCIIFEAQFIQSSQLEKWVLSIYLRQLEKWGLSICSSLSEK